MRQNEAVATYLGMSVEEIGEYEYQSTRQVQKCKVYAVDSSYFLALPVTKKLPLTYRNEGYHKVEDTYLFSLGYWIYRKEQESRIMPE